MPDVQESPLSLEAYAKGLSLSDTPRYSVLASVDSTERLKQFATLAEYGIRVFLLINGIDEQLALNSISKEFLLARLVEYAFTNSSLKHSSLVDGRAESATDKTLLDELANSFAGSLNREQYFVVHALPSNNVIVRAGAGTGKTETMAERIVFVLATQMTLESDGKYSSNFDFDSIALVTFTNLATNEMRARINRVVIYRQRLCRRNVLPTMDWISGVGRIRISTIHKFALSLLKTHGREVGYGPDVVMGFGNSDFNRWIYDGGGTELAEVFTRQNFEWAQQSYVWRDALKRIWEKILENGVDVVSDSDKIVWHSSTGLSETDVRAVTVVENAMRYLANQVENFSLENQQIPTNLIVMRAANALKVTQDRSTKLRYLFVDEFQDSDPSQIELFRLLDQKFGVNLFVVGDVKQGVYRFRGASGNAFEIVEQLFSAGMMRRPEEFTLKTNFRSGTALLNSLLPLFQSLGSDGLLDYVPRLDDLIPGRPDVASSGFSVERTSKANLYSTAARMVAEVKLSEPDASVGVLVRENNQARKAQAAIRELGISCEIVSGGTFFQSDAVRELIVLIDAVLSPTNNAKILSLLESRWGSGISNSEQSPLSSPGAADGWATQQFDFLDWRQRISQIADQDPGAYRDLEAFRSRVVAIRNLAMKLPLLDWVVLCRNVFLPDAVSRRQLDDDVIRKQYGRNLDHLLAILDDHFGGAGVTLDSVRQFLTLKLATDKSVDEIFVQDEVQSEGVTVALTVHKAKGLEFDHVVVLPSESGFRKSDITVVRSPQSKPLLLWELRGPGNSRQIIKNFPTSHPAKAADEFEGAKEEARLFYVAMTRAKKALTFLSFRRPQDSAGVPKSWDEFLNRWGGHSNG
jgi:superfamily I DNA/RNA helicase